MDDNKLLDEIKSRYNRDYLKMVNEQGVISGKNNWELVFRDFAMERLAELELRLRKFESSK